jgi:aminotransferase in exopolysaccharide biosynthesis
MSSLARQVVAAIKSVVGPGPAVLHEPLFRGNEWNYVKECIDSTFVASGGRFVTQFENDLSCFTGSPYVVAVSSGTAALHIALCVAGVLKNEEVLVPDLSFVATANAVSYCGAIPHFVDCEENTLGVSPARLRRYLEKAAEKRGDYSVNRETGRVIKALIPMHTFGHPAAMDELLQLARDCNLIIVEDAAESLGSFYGKRHTGTLGLAGVLSFNGNKTITTGGGGAILTGDKKFASMARHLSQTAKVPHPWNYQHDQIGFNYRLPNLNAALGCAQLEQLPSLIDLKRKLFQHYKSAFEEIQSVKLFSEPLGARSNYWLQTLMLEEDKIAEQEDILQDASRAGYMLRPAWQCLSDLEPYRDSPRMANMISKRLASRLINIPSSPQIVRNGST